MPLWGSTPTPITNELLRVVTKEALGAPVDAFPVPTAPMAPEPFVPEVSTPAKLMTVIEDVTFCERVAVTDTVLSGIGAKARQISAVPFCVRVLLTSTQVRPAPEMLFTLVLVPNLQSAATRARSNSFPLLVEKAGEVTLELALD